MTGTITGVMVTKCEFALHVSLDQPYFLKCGFVQQTILWFDVCVPIINSITLCGRPWQQVELSPIIIINSITLCAIFTNKKIQVYYYYFHIPSFG
jgi:hypothetical protein